MGFKQDIKEVIEFLKEKIWKFKYTVSSSVINMLYYIVNPMKFKNETIILHWLITAAGFVLVFLLVYPYEKTNNCSLRRYCP